MAKTNSKPEETNNQAENTENNSSAPEETTTAPDVKKDVVKYRNNNNMKVELLIEGKSVTVPAKGIIEIPVDQYDAVKPHMFGAWFKVNEVTQ